VSTDPIACKNVAVYLELLGITAYRSRSFVDDLRRHGGAGGRQTLHDRVCAVGAAG